MICIPLCNWAVKCFKIGAILPPNTLEDNLFSWTSQGFLRKQAFTPSVVGGSIVIWRLPLMDKWLVAGISPNLL